MRADVVVPVRADVVGGKVELSRFCTHFAPLSFVQVLSRDDVNYFYISIKLVVTSAFYVGCETIRLTEPCSIGRATCDDFAVKSDCVDFLFVVLSFVKR